MNELIPVLVVCGLFAVLIIGWLMIAFRPEKWVPPGSNPPSPYTHSGKPKPPANPPKGPALRIEIQRRAQKSVDSLASQGERHVRRVICVHPRTRRAA